MSDLWQGLAGGVVGCLILMTIGLLRGDAVAQEAELDQTIKAEWQTITYSGKATVRRTRVPTGWLVIIESVNTGDYDPMMIPDPGHEWLNIEAERTTFGSYVAADRSTHEVIAPEFRKYIKYTINDAHKVRYRRTLESWKARIEAAEANNR